MWLLPLLTRLSRATVGIYYRFSVDGESVPERGPLLLVANHPNSLVDAGAVAIAARRPIRFLAKAPLFRSPAIGWLVRGSGAIPVHRPEDTAGRERSNVGMFAAVHEALTGGSAIGIFPEGWSHSEPGLTPLKTGAARIALGAAARTGRPFPIVPVGLTFREKVRFRSEALALVGRPVQWADLAGRAPTDPEAVQELTRRIERGIRRVTVNLGSWADRPLVETAEEIAAAELGGAARPQGRVRRMQAVGEALAKLRRDDPDSVGPLGRDLLRHRRLLDTLGLRPTDLGSVPGILPALWWALRRAAFFGVAAPLAALGILLFYLPYRLTAWFELRYRPIYDVRATFRMLVGAFLFLVWLGLLAGTAGWLLEWRWAVGTAVAAPVLGLIALWVRDRWSEARANARRYLLLRGREDVRRRLAERQRELARELESVRRRVFPRAQPRAHGPDAGP